MLQLCTAFASNLMQAQSYYFLDFHYFWNLTCIFIIKTLIYFWMHRDGVEVVDLVRVTQIKGV